MTSNQEYVDANVLLRLGRRDVPAQVARSEKYLRAALEGGTALVVAPTTVSEFVYVLSGAVLAYSRNDVVSAIENLLALPFQFEDASVVASALTLYRDHHPDWDDCVVAAYALERADGRLVSFDRGLSRIPGLQRQEPGA